MFSRASRAICSIVAVAFVALTHVNTAVAQSYPAWAGPIYQPTASVDLGVSNVSAPNGAYGTALLSVYSSGGHLGYNVSTDGQNIAYSTVATNVPGINCTAATPATCAAGVAVIGGNIYAAYSDASSHGLDIVQFFPIAGNAGYTTQLVIQDNSVTMVTSPAETVSPDGQNLVFLYGASNDPSTKNQFFRDNLHIDGTFTYANEGGNLQSLRLSSASTPAMVAFNGQIWLCAQQNDSQKYLMIYNTDSTGQTWNFVGPNELYTLGGGANMVVYNNTLVMADQQNASSRYLTVLVSPNGTTWNAYQYPYQAGGVPGLANYNGGLSVGFKGDNSNAFYGAWTNTLMPQ
jgi:hypothetical protein